VLGADGSAQVAIENLEVINLTGKVDLREALEWAEANQPTLITKWAELSGER
jgi:hypothetical protein